jgi:hypothetical protein
LHQRRGHQMSLATAPERAGNLRCRSLTMKTLGRGRRRRAMTASALSADWRSTIDDREAFETAALHYVLDGDRDEWPVREHFVEEVITDALVGVDDRGVREHPDKHPRFVAGRLPPRWRSSRWATTATWTTQSSRRSSVSLRRRRSVSPPSTPESMQLPGSCPRATTCGPRLRLGAAARPRSALVARRATGADRVTL